MIIAFADSETQKLFNTGHSIRFANIERLALRKLDMINAACNINTLRIPPGNHLEKLKGDRKNSYSIKINDQWRICFKWNDKHAYDVEIVDYH